MVWHVYTYPVSLQEVRCIKLLGHSWEIQHSGGTKQYQRSRGLRLLYVVAAGQPSC